MSSNLHLVLCSYTFPVSLNWQHVMVGVVEDVVPKTEVSSSIHVSVSAPIVVFLGALQSARFLC